MSTYNTLFMIPLLSMLVACESLSPRSAFVENDAEALAFRAAATERMALYQQSMADGDSDLWSANWTEDGVQLAPGSPARVGLSNIVAVLERDMAVFDFEMDIEVDESYVHGDMGYVSGNYTATLTAKDGSMTIPVDGKYLSIYQKQQDGSWKIYRDIFNSNVE